MLQIRFENSLRENGIQLLEQISAAVNLSFSLRKHVHCGHDEGCRIGERRAIGSRLGCGDGIPSWPLCDCEGGAKCSTRSSSRTADLHPLHSNTISNPQG